MRTRFRHGAVVLAALLSLLPAGACADPKVDVDGVVQNDVASQITITRVFAFVAQSGNPFSGQSNQLPVECVFFKNASPTAAKHVRFYFTYTGTDGADAGKVVGQDFIDIRGTFGTGIAQEMWPPRSAPVYGKQCRLLPGATQGGHMYYDVKREDVTLSGYVSQVDYTDGTTWQLPTPATTSTPSP